MIKLTLKKERENTVSAKIAFFNQCLWDQIYSCTLKLKGTNVYISKNLTHAKSTLAYEARQHTKTREKASTWTTDNTIFLKHTAETMCHSNTNDLKPAGPPLTNVKYNLKEQHTLLQQENTWKTIKNYYVKNSNQISIILIRASQQKQTLYVSIQITAINTNTILIFRVRIHMNSIV